MVEIHLYGRLRRYAQQAGGNPDNIIRLAPKPDETVETLLKRVGIEDDKIFHIFLNGKLLATRNTLAIWLRYQQIRSNPHDWNTNFPVSDGDRIGLFGHDMASLVV